MIKVNSKIILKSLFCFVFHKFVFERMSCLHSNKMWYGYKTIIYTTFEICLNILNCSIFIFHEISFKFFIQNPLKIDVHSSSLETIYFKFCIST